MLALLTELDGIGSGQSSLMSETFKTNKIDIDKLL